MIARVFIFSQLKYTVRGSISFVNVSEIIKQCLVETADFALFWSVFLQFQTMAGYESFTDIATDKGVEDPNLSSGKVYSFIYPIYLFVYLFGAV